MSDVLFLAHRINESCISQDLEKIKPVSNWHVPVSVTNVRQFLGFAIGRIYWKTCAFRVEHVSAARILDLETGAAVEIDEVVLLWPLYCCNRQMISHGTLCRM